MDDTRPCADIGCTSVELSKICTFPADPDIAGIGVVLSFFISVTLSLLLALYGFYFIEGSFVTNQLTTLDVVITGPVNAIIEKFSKGQQPLITQEVFRDVIQIFSDQQLVTGLAILTVAFCRATTITEYHFAVVSDLANMALVVQFCASDILGEYLGQRPAMIWWRATAFVALAVLSMITLVPWGNRYYLYTYGSEMACLWTKTSGNYTTSSTAQMTLYMVLSLWGIIGTLGQYFPVIMDNRLMNGARNKIVACILWPRRLYIRSQQSNNVTTASRVSRALLRGLAFLVFIVTEIVYTQAFELMRNGAMLVVTVADVFHLRSLASENGRVGNEDAWGFGQAVPMFLLMLPLFTLFELYFDGFFRRRVAEKQLLKNQQDGVELSHFTGATTITSAGVQNRGDDSLRRHQLAIPNSKGPASASPAISLANGPSTTPRLCVANGTNAGNYYFSYPAAKLGATDFEDEFYRRLEFRISMRFLMSAVFIGVTTAARYGWAV